jgi:hypothetical protein
MRESAITSVQAVLDGADAEELHAVWCRGKAAEGWRRGEFKDPAARIHPDLVPFGELPQAAQVKDRLFVAIVREMSGESPAWFRSLLLERAQEAIAFERERAEKAEAKAARYENAITWNTSCTSCAAVLDSCYAETVRAEKAEAGRDTLARQIAGEADDLAAEADALFPMMDADIRRVLSGRLRKMIAGTGTVAAEAESNAGGREDSGTADGMAEGGAAA